MPSPSASDGGSDNTSVAAAAVWMRMLAGMLPPKMLSTAAAAGRGAQVAAQDQRAPSGRRRLSQLRSRHSTPGTLTRVRARPAQITRRPCSAAGSASASTSAKGHHQKFFQLNNWVAHACFALSYSGSHDVVTVRMHMRKHMRRRSAERALIWLSYEKKV